MAAGTATKSLSELTANDIVMVYSGRPGCGCGCRGNYRFMNEADIEATHSTSGKVNAAQVKAVLKAIQAGDAAQLRYDEYALAGSGEPISGIWSLETETRYLWAYVR